MFQSFLRCESHVRALFRQCDHEVDGFGGDLGPLLFLEVDVAGFVAGQDLAHAFGPEGRPAGQAVWSLQYVEDHSCAEDVYFGGID